MFEKIETWCYGGKNKVFFVEQGEAIHQYNSKMLERLLIIMTIIILAYLAVSTGSGIFSKYTNAYLTCCTALLFLLCSFKIKVHKSVILTRVYIILFSVVMFFFVCMLGTVYEPYTRSTLFIVYVLVLPMLFISPTHYTYGFLTIATCVFSVIALQLKSPYLAQMDIAHSVTCLVIGIFLSHHILESRLELYELNKQLDTRNFQLDKQLQEKEQQLLHSRILILLSQIQPHFLYNTLTAICGLCDENPKEAKKVTAEFADYLRHNLDTLNKNTPVPFIDELQHTQLYLRIEKKRFEDRLNIAYDIECSDFQIPALTMQPLVENAVNHGVTKKKDGGTVIISTREQKNWVEIHITDDGIGFDDNLLQMDDNTHIGIENVRDRLWSMCGGTLTVVSQVGTGTVATIKIPWEKRSSQ